MNTDTLQKYKEDNGKDKSRSDRTGIPLVVRQTAIVRGKPVP